jgi:hypothetical protein
MKPLHAKNGTNLDQKAIFDGDSAVGEIAKGVWRKLCPLKPGQAYCCILGFDGCFQALKLASEKALGNKKAVHLFKPSVEFFHLQDTPKRYPDIEQFTASSKIDPTNRPISRKI